MPYDGIWILTFRIQRRKSRYPDFCDSGFGQTEGDELKKGDEFNPEPTMNAIVFWIAAACLYAANTWHLLWLPLVWICFPGVLVAHGIALLFDIPAMRNADKAIESAGRRNGEILLFQDLKSYSADLAAISETQKSGYRLLRLRTGARPIPTTHTNWLNSPGHPALPPWSARETGTHHLLAARRKGGWKCFRLVTKVARLPPAPPVPMARSRGPFTRAN